jgi:hypothetical protein
MIKLVLSRPIAYMRGPSRSSGGKSSGGEAAGHGSSTLERVIFPPGNSSSLIFSAASHVDAPQWSG